MIKIKSRKKSKQTENIIPDRNFIYAIKRIVELQEIIKQRNKDIEHLIKIYHDLISFIKKDLLIPYCYKVEIIKFLKKST